MRFTFLLTLCVLARVILFAQTNCPVDASFTSSQPACSGQQIVLQAQPHACSGNALNTSAGSANGQFQGILESALASNFSLDLYVRPNANSATAGKQVLLRYGSINGGVQLFINASNFLQIAIPGTSGLQSTTSLAPLVWQRLVLTKQGTTWALYLNGNPVNLNTNSRTLNTVDGQVQVGAENLIGQSRFQGMVDDVRIWLRALSASETVGGPLACNNPEPGNDQLIGYWNFNELSGAAINQTGTTADLQLEAGASRATSAIYKWSWPGGAADGITTNASFSQPGIFQLSLQIEAPGCTQNSTQNIQVYNPPVITSYQGPTEQSVCEGGNVTLGVNVNAYQPSFQWYSNNVQANTGGQLIPGANNPVYQPPTFSPGIQYYYVVVSSACGQVTSIPLKAEVVQSPIIQAQPLNFQTMCQQAPTTRLDFIVAGTAPITYQWFSSNIPANYGGNAIAGATGPSFTPPSNAAGTFYYYAVATNSCGSMASDPATVLVSPSTAIAQQPQTTLQACQNVPALLTTGATGTGSLYYQWFQAPSNTNTVGNAIPGANGPDFQVPVNTVGTYYYYAVVTGDCGIALSNPSTVVVNTTLSFNQQPAATLSVCAGGNASLAGAATSTTPIGYQWYSNTVNSNQGGTPISGANAQNFAVPTNVAGQFYYYLAATDQCGTQFSNVSVVDVLPAPVINNVVSSTGCMGSSLSPIGVVATGPGLAYQWYSSATNTNSGGTLINGATNFVYTPSSAQAGTFYYYAVVTNNCGNTVSSAIPVVVNAATAVTTQPAAQVNLCINGNSQPLTVAATGTGTLSYQWYSNTSNANTGGTAISGATTASYQPPTSQAGNFYYYATVTGSCGSASSAVSAVSVLNPPQIVTQPLATQTICQNANATTLSLSASGAGTLSYQWYVNTYNSVVGATAINGATSSSYTPPTNTAGTRYYFAQVSNGGCQVASALAEVISKVSVIDISASSATVCSNTSITQLQASYRAGDATYVFSSGDLNIPIPDKNTSGMNHAIEVSNVSNSGVDSIIVSFTILHPFIGDLTINLEAPNARIINLVNRRGNSGDNFVNTRISSDPGRNAIPSIGAPYTGTFRADAVVLTSFLPATNTQAFPDLYGTLNGQWKLRVYDLFATDSGYLANWSIKIASYNPNANVVWTPNGSGSGLYSDTAATIVYNGEPASTVFAKLDGYAKIYTASTTLDGCAATGSYTLARTNFVEITAASNCEGSPITGNISGVAGMLKWMRNGIIQAVQKDSVYDNVGLTIKNNILSYGLDIDTAGNIYYANPDSHAVFKLPKGSSTPIIVAGGNGAGSGANQLNFPSGLFLEKNGNLYIADYQNNRVQKWTPGATQGTTVVSGLTTPVAVFVDPNGVIFVTEYDRHRVRKWGGGSNGVVVAGQGYSGSGADLLLYPYGIYVDSTGNLYVADQGNNRVQRWAPGATIGVTVAGGKGIGTSANQTGAPFAIKMDKAGNLWIAEYNPSRISKWKPGAASGTTIVNNFNDPTYPYGFISFAFDADSILYVGDNQYKRLQRFGQKGPLPATFMFNATTSGLYQAIVYNSNGCTDTSNVIAIGTEADKGYFRTTGTGSWNNPAIWQTSFDNKKFIPACSPPGIQALSIEVQPQHTVTISENISIKKLNVQTGGAVNITNGAKVDIQKQQ